MIYVELFFGFFGFFGFLRCLLFQELFDAGFEGLRFELFRFGLLRGGGRGFCKQIFQVFELFQLFDFRFGRASFFGLGGGLFRRGFLGGRGFLFQLFEGFELIFEGRGFLRFFAELIPETGQQFGQFLVLFLCRRLDFGNGLAAAVEHGGFVTEVYDVRLELLKIL